MTEYILAFKPSHLGTHDYSACLLADGEIIAAAEEERFCRKKHANNTFPYEAIRYCLNVAQIDLSELEVIGIPYEPSLYIKNLSYMLDSIFRSREFINKYNHVGNAINKLTFTHYGKERIWNLLDPNSKIKHRPPIQFISHHLSHAASAYFCSGLNSASVITIDALGEYDCTVLWSASNGKLTRLKTFAAPNSLGLFYSIFTEFLGFRRLDGEGKLMGLAPYGQYNSFLESFFNRYAKCSCGLYDVSSFVREFTSLSKLEQVLGIPKRCANEELSPIHANIAWHVQNFIERVIVELVRENYRKTGFRNVCLAGGVALNCSVNKQVMKLDCVDNLFVQPAANDAGLALGCAQVISKKLHHNPLHKIEHIFFGPSYSNDEIETTLRLFKIPYKRIESPAYKAAELLAEDKLLGWFQGRMELGPRALGNRSILANPSKSLTKDRLNQDIKRRELWRPFAPSILSKEANNWFQGCSDSPFMTTSFDTKSECWEKIEAVVHPIDKTARVQTVSIKNNEIFYKLIEKFESITGFPLVLNTSFNLAGEPIVCTPEQAIVDFYRSGLDVLIIGDFMLQKSQ